MVRAKAGSRMQIGEGRNPSMKTWILLCSYQRNKWNNKMNEWMNEWQRGRALAEGGSGLGFAARQPCSSEWVTLTPCTPVPPNKMAELNRVTPKVTRDSMMLWGSVCGAFDPTRREPRRHSPVRAWEEVDGGVLLQSRFLGCSCLLQAWLPRWGATDFKNCALSQ